MTPAELERLALLVEEAAEVQQIAMKIIRHGYESYNPFDESKTPNRQLLEKEIGDFEYALALMHDNNDIDWKAVERASRHKRINVKKYLHHNEP